MLSHQPASSQPPSASALPYYSIAMCIITHRFHLVPAAGEAEEGGEGKVTEGTGLGESDTTGAKDISKEVGPPSQPAHTVPAYLPALRACLPPSAKLAKAEENMHGALRSASLDVPASAPAPHYLPPILRPSLLLPACSWRTRISCWEPSRREPRRSSSSSRRSSRALRRSRSRVRVPGCCR